MLPLIINILIIAVGVFLVGVVLIQRGKGGGLAGAFGGAGGSSPFGSKAGDAFTKFTAYVFLVWLALIVVQVRVMNSGATATPALPGAAQ